MFSMGLRSELFAGHGRTLTFLSCRKSRKESAVWLVVMVLVGGIVMLEGHVRMSLQEGYHMREGHVRMSLQEGYHMTEGHVRMSLQEGYHMREGHVRMSLQEGYHMREQDVFPETLSVEIACNDNKLSPMML
jgi:hypothetical protein